MKGENVVHLKFDYPEAIAGKKEILFTEKDVVNLMRVVKTYNLLRREEIKMKIEFDKKLKELSNKFKSLQNTLPKFDTDRFMNKEEERLEIHDEIVNGKKPQEQVKQRTIRPSDDIETQLKDIQRRLNEIGG